MTGFYKATRTLREKIFNNSSVLWFSMSFGYDVVCPFMAIASSGYTRLVSCHRLLRTPIVISRIGLENATSRFSDVTMQRQTSIVKVATIL